MQPVHEPVLAISPENDRMHVGDAAVVLAHVTAEQPILGSGLSAVAWQFYDSLGRSLVEDGGALVLADEAAALPPRPARQVLVARIDLVLAHAQLRLDRDIAARVAGGEPPTDDERVRMVRVEGELADVATMLFALAPDLQPNPVVPHSASWWHNFWAH